jgi:ribosomal protein S18 acetylase RimI-like enzyme
MPDLKYIPISCVDETLLQPLMEDEERMWRADLDWDYTPIRQVLVAFIKQKLLPGYVAIADRKALGYTYFLINQSKGIIGALYAMNTAHSQEAVDELLALSISSLKDAQNTKRVEAQIIPFHHLNIASAFTRNGFSHYRRYYLDLDLGNHRERAELLSAVKIIPWDATYLARTAEMTLRSYANQVDAEICEDYCTRTGCESYLRSLVETPGCGIFIPEASFIGLGAQGNPCGFVFCCCISNRAAIIPQVAVHPLYQGMRLGNTLMNRAFAQLKALGFRTVSLTVTKENLRAFEWYQHLGFKMHKEFGAYVWQREPIHE